MQVTRECSEDRLGRRGLQSDNGDNNGAVVFGLFELVALEGKLSCLRRGEAECSGAGFADLPVHRSTTRVHKTTRLTLNMPLSPVDCQPAPDRQRKPVSGRKRVHS